MALCMCTCLNDCKGPYTCLCLLLVVWGGEGEGLWNDDQLLFFPHPIDKWGRPNVLQANLHWSQPNTHSGCVPYAFTLVLLLLSSPLSLSKCFIHRMGSCKWLYTSLHHWTTKFTNSEFTRYVCVFAFVCTRPSVYMCVHMYSGYVSMWTCSRRACVMTLFLQVNLLRGCRRSMLIVCLLCEHTSHVCSSASAGA